MQVLIVGFGRSGTTLTFRTFRAHPQIGKAFLETCHLGFHTKDVLLKKIPAFKNKNCVEKVIYGNDNIRKRAFILDMSIYDYCQRWLDYFGDEARIIQLVRHPLDTLASLIIKRGRLMKVRKNLKNIVRDDIPQNIQERLINGYFNVIPKYPRMIATLPQTKTIKYENILLNTKETLNSMFKFCNLQNHGIERLRKDRAFNYTNSGFRVDHPIDEVVKVFNSISDGVKYQLP